MKSKWLVVAVVLAIFISSITAYADQVPVSDINAYDIDATVLPDGRTVKSVIVEASAEYWCKNFFPDDTAGYAIYYDLNEYAVQYENGVREWKADSTVKGVVSGMNGYPTIFIPIFAVIEGRERIIGHVKVYYDYLRNVYKTQPTIMYLDSEFISGEKQHFLEELGMLNDYRDIRISLGEEELRSVVLINRSYLEMGDRLALVMTASGNLMVYDYMNCAHIQDLDSSKLMTVEAFADAYDAYLSKVENVESGDRWAAGGDSLILSEQLSSNEWIAPVIILFVTITGTMVTAVLVQKKKRKLAASPVPENDENTN